MWSEAIKLLPPGATRIWLIVVGEMFVLAVMMLGLTILWVASRVERSRQERPATTRQLLWRNYLIAPRFWKSLFRSKMRRTLDRNPIGWLQQYSTEARMTRWGWCLFIVIAESVLVARVYWEYLEWPQYWLLLLLALSLAASAAGSFRRERETGALELILVTPLSVPQIIFGRLRGLWRQFLPALGMLLAVLAFLVQTGLRDPWYWRREDYAVRDGAMAVLVVCTFATLPVVGLYSSLSYKHFFSAWLSTLGVCGVLPGLLSGFLFVLFTVFPGSLYPRASGATILARLLFQAGGFQIVFALIAFTLLYRNLRQRKFALAS